MMMMMTDGTSALGIIGMLLMVIVAIAWILLPFAMFGMGDQGFVAIR